MSLSIAGALLALALTQTAKPAGAPLPPPPAGARTTSGAPPQPAPASATSPQVNPDAPAGVESSATGLEQPYPHFGLALDAAAPAGATLNFVYRPVPFLRLWIGPAWNYLSFGGQAGLGLAPFQWAVTPVLSLEVGRYRSANVKARFGVSGGGAADDASVLLEDVSLRYGALMLGFEMGSPRGFSFGLRVGLTRLWIMTNRTATFSADQNGQATTLTLVEPTGGGVAPALKLGFTYWF